MSCGKRDCKRKARTTPSYCRCGVEFCSEACFVSEWHARHQYACPKAVEIKQALVEARTRPGLPPTKMLVSCALTQKAPEGAADVSAATLNERPPPSGPVVPPLALAGALGLPEVQVSQASLSAQSFADSISPGSSIASTTAAPPYEGQQQPLPHPPACDKAEKGSLRSWTSASDAPRSWTTASASHAAQQSGSSPPERPASAAAASAQSSTRSSLDTQSETASSASEKRRSFKRFSKNDFETVGDAIGSGSYGQVMKVMHTPTGDIYAMKSIPKQKVVEHEMTPYLMREVKTQLTIQHPRMVRLYYYFEDADYVKLLLEYAGGGSLFSVMRKRGRLPERDATRYFLDIAGALNYLHEHKIIHRDLKPENILMCAPNIAKLADFGWCAELAREGAQRNTFCGTWDYLSPEMIQSTPHDFTVDVWATGVLVYEMLTARPPFHHTSQQKAMHRILAVDLQIPDFVSHKARALISALIVKKPENRLSLLDAMQHPWVLSHVSEDDVREAVAQAVRQPENRSTVASTLSEASAGNSSGTRNRSALDRVDEQANRPTADALKARPVGSGLAGQPCQPTRDEERLKREQEQEREREKERLRQQDEEREKERERALEFLREREKEREAERRREKEREEEQERFESQARLQQPQQQQQQQQSCVASQNGETHPQGARPQESHAFLNSSTPLNSSTLAAAQPDAIDETLKRHLAAMRRNLGVEDPPSSKPDLRSQLDKVNHASVPSGDSKLDTSVRAIPREDLDVSSRQPWQKTDTFAKLRSWVRKNTSDKVGLVEDLDRTLRSTVRDLDSGPTASCVRSDPDDGDNSMSKTVPTMSLGINGFLRSPSNTSQAFIGAGTGGAGALGGRQGASQARPNVVPDSPFEGGFFEGGGGASGSKASAAVEASAAVATGGVSAAPAAHKAVVGDSPFDAGFFDAAAEARSGSGGHREPAPVNAGALDSPFGWGFFDPVKRDSDPPVTSQGTSDHAAKGGWYDPVGDAKLLRPSDKQPRGRDVHDSSTSSPRTLGSVFAGGFLDAPLEPPSAAMGMGSSSGSRALAAPPPASAPCITQSQGESAVRLTNLKELSGQLMDARTAICNDLDATNRSLRSAFDTGPAAAAAAGRSNHLPDPPCGGGSKGWNEINKDLDCMTETFKGQLDKLIMFAPDDESPQPIEKNPGARPRSLTPTRGLKL